MIGIGTGVQALLGLGQLAGGLLTKPKRPKYQIPGAVNEATSTARSLAANSLRPGDAQATANIRQSTANAVNTLKTTSSNAAQILNAANRINVGERQAFQQNNALNADFSFRAKQGLLGQLNTMAGYQDRQFQYNQADPYAQRANLKSSLIGSGLQNLWGASEQHSFLQMYKDLYSKPTGG